MRIKKIFAGLIAGACLVSSGSMSFPAFADKAVGQEYDLKGLDPEQSSVKPTLSLSQIKVPINVVKENPVQKIELSVEGADKKYAPTGLHIKWDERLTLVFQDDEAAQRGEVIKDESGWNVEILPYDNDKAMFLTTAGKNNSGTDGVLWEFLLQVPEDAQVGDKYPIEIEYQSRLLADDLFNNEDKDEEGNLMQAWVFTQGIQHGFIHHNFYNDYGRNNNFHHNFHNDYGRTNNFHHNFYNDYGRNNNFHHNFYNDYGRNNNFHHNFHNDYGRNNNFHHNFCNDYGRNYENYFKF